MTGKCTYNITLRGVRVTTVAVEKQCALHILSVRLQPEVSSMQCACAILSSVACPAVQYFSTLSHKLHDFRTKFIEHKTRFDSIYNFCLKYFSF
jgi:hypothetical protein